MATSTYKTFLMVKGEGSTFEKLIDIKDYPDLGGTPEMLETTTLSDGSQRFTPGIDSSEALEFTANYDLDDYKTLLALKDTETEFSLWFGGTVDAGVVTPSGDRGKFDFKGYLSTVVSGGGVNEVQDMRIVIAPSSGIELNSLA